MKWNDLFNIDQIRLGAHALPDHPGYEEIKEWARFWTPELSDWEKRPRVIHM